MITSISTGKGIDGRDKLRDLTPQQGWYNEGTLLDWYRAVPFIKRPVNLIAEEMYREGFTVDTGNPELDKAVEEKMRELEFEKALVQCEKDKLIYNNGGLLYLAFDSMIPQTEAVLNAPIPPDACLCYINPVPAYEFSVLNGGTDPLKKNYHRPTILMRGIEIHKSRYCWNVADYDGRYNRGESLVNDLIDIGKGLDLSLWSTANMVYEAQVKVYKSNPVRDSGKNVVEKLLDKIKTTMSSQSAVVIGETEDFNKLNFQAAGLDQAFNFLWDCNGIISTVPSNIMKGQTKRVISLQNDPELIGFYSNIERRQEAAEKAVVRPVVDLIIRGLTGSVPEYKIKWNPLYILDDSTKADIALKTSQADSAYVTAGVLSPQDVTGMRFPDIETVNSNPNTDYEVPEPMPM